MIYGDNPLRMGSRVVPDIYAIKQSSNLYVYSLNNPLRWIDPSGYVIKLSSKATAAEKQEYERAKAYLKTSKTAKALIERLEKPESGVVTIKFFRFSDKQNRPRYDEKTQTIWWDPTGGVRMNGMSVVSPADVLAHEFGHRAQHLDHEMDAYIVKPTRSESLKIEKANLKRYETPIAEELGEPTRSSYKGNYEMKRMNNSIHYRTTSYGYFGIFDRSTIDHNGLAVMGGTEISSQP